MNLFTDLRQLALFHNGDRKIFDKVFKASLNTIYLKAYRMLQHSGEAEDVVAEMRLKLWEKKDTFRDHGHVKAFLLVATRNRCLDLLRKKGRGTIKIGGYDHLPEVADVDEASLLSHDKIEEQVFTLVQTAVIEAINGMPERCREVAHLCIINGKSVKEAAQIMRIKEGTVHTQLTKAKKLLRVALKNFEFLLMMLLTCLCQSFF